MKKPPVKKRKKQPLCEICEKLVKHRIDLQGCTRCHRLFGSCCNAIQDDRCVQCEL